MQPNDCNAVLQLWPKRRHLDCIGWDGNSSRTCWMYCISEQDLRDRYYTDFIYCLLVMIWSKYFVSDSLSFLPTWWISLTNYQPATGTIAVGDIRSVVLRNFSVKWRTKCHCLLQWSDCWCSNRTIIWPVEMPLQLSAVEASGDLVSPMVNVDNTCRSVKQKPDWLRPRSSHSCWSIGWRDFSTDSDHLPLCKHHCSWLASSVNPPGMFVARSSLDVLFIFCLHQVPIA